MSLLRGIDSLNFIPCRKQKLTFSAAYRSWSPEGADGLEHLHHEHQQHDADDHDVGLVAVVAVGKGDLAQAPPPMTPDMAE